MSKARDLANAGTALTTVSATELGYLDGVTSAIQTQINTKDSLPSRSGQSGKYLTNNGTDASWGTVSQYSLPSQSGNSGKFLTTNGTAESWGTPTAGEGWDLLVNGTTFTSTSSYSLSLTGGYDKYRIHIKWQNDSGGTLYSSVPFRFNNSSAAEYSWAPNAIINRNSTSSAAIEGGWAIANNTSVYGGDTPFKKGYDSNVFEAEIFGCQSTTKYKRFEIRGYMYEAYYGYWESYWWLNYGGIWKNTSALTTLNIVPTSGSVTGIAVYVWGSN